MSTFDFKILDPSHCNLKESTIDLWFISLERTLDTIETLLNPEEQQRASRFHFERHKRRFSHARGWLRIILSRYLNNNPQDIAFTYNEHGKPEINHPADIQFNVSHSGEWAIIAIGKKHPLGIDLETYSARPFHGIAKHLFSPEEQQMLQQTPPVEKPWVFFNIWTQKEAFIKACGLGLFYPTQEFTVNLNQEKDLLIFDRKQNTHWQMKTFMPRAALAAALCHHPDVSQINYLALKDERL